jgi:ribonuclease HII
MKILQVVGIDEVGRGSWAGPVVSAAVVLTKPIVGLTDSKLLPKHQREFLADEIKKHSVWAVSFLPATYIDEAGLTVAIRETMKQALSQINCDYDQVIIDGKYNFMPDNYRVRTVIRADLTVPAVSAASILAKVARDNYMAEQAVLYPAYGFEKHVGYGTALHRQALKQYGVCKLHRLSYKPIKTIIT